MLALTTLVLMLSAADVPAPASPAPSEQHIVGGAQPRIDAAARDPRSVVWLSPSPAPRASRGGCVARRAAVAGLGFGIVAGGAVAMSYHDRGNGFLTFSRGETALVSGGMIGGTAALLGALTCALPD